METFESIRGHNGFAWINDCVRIALCFYKPRNTSALAEGIWVVRRGFDGETSKRVTSSQSILRHPTHGHGEEDIIAHSSGARVLLRAFFGLGWLSMAATFSVN